MGFEVLPAAFFPYATAPRCHTALKVSSGAHNCSAILTRWCSHPLRDEGLVGLQMLPSPWLAMGFFSIPAHVLSRARVIFLFFRGFSYYWRVLGMAVKRCLWGCRFCTKPTQTVLDRGIPCVAWSMLDLFLGNPEAARPTNNQQKSHPMEQDHDTLTVLVEQPYTGHSALGFHHQQVPGVDQIP